MKKIQSLVKFTQKHSNIAYNESAKNEFKRVGKAALKELMILLGPVHAAEISYNPGGIAVSGDFHLKVMLTEKQGVDLFFNLDFQPCITYRGIKGLKDYTGHQNQRMSFSDLLNIETVVSKINTTAQSVPTI